jgi:hypothetical protein
MSPTSDQYGEHDETRLCPTCRMPISILAVRCRYCNDDVGRPRKEQETLTVKDLGGQSKASYTISGNVMDALESFRAEEITAQELERRRKEEASSSWFGHRAGGGTGSDPGFQLDPDMPELDASHQELVSSGQQSSSSQSLRAPEPAIPVNLRLAAAAVIGLVAGFILLGAMWIIFFARDTAPMQQGPISVNRAPRMLEQGAPVLEVLKEANRALRADASVENEGIVMDVRERLVQDVRGFLTAKPWMSADLSQASKMATQAALIDSSDTVKGLSKLVRGEVAAYSLVLSYVDAESQRATFTLQDPSHHNTDKVTVRTNEMVQGRFLIKHISPKNVRMIDTKVPYEGAERALHISLNGQITGA